MSREETTENGQGLNPGYAAFQIARALVTVEEHPDPAVRERARLKVARWQAVLTNIAGSLVQYGSRTPLANVPAWATPLVIDGGFVTGELLAEGALQDHEVDLLRHLPPILAGDERRALNAYFLSEEGLQQLIEMLRTGKYEIRVPEEGALLTVAWLVSNGHLEAAQKLLDSIAPFLDRLRFYPVPLDRRNEFGLLVHHQDVSDILDSLACIGQNPNILAQRESVTVWTPIYDRVVSLFLETQAGEWPCQVYPDDWMTRVRKLLSEYDQARSSSTICKRLENPGKHYGQLLNLLRKCASDPSALTGRDVGMVRHILKCYIAKHGFPYSSECRNQRSRQIADVAAPTYQEVAKIVTSRLQRLRKDEGINDVDSLITSTTQEEEVATGVPSGTSVPRTIARKVERGVNDTVDGLVQRGIIKSGDTLAGLLPQLTAHLRATSIIDPDLGRLYAAVYRSFRRRRSLLLLDLQKQVQIDELPWVAPVQRYRSDDRAGISKQTLCEVVALTLGAFPHAILPNKLLQEIRALAKDAKLDIPILEELAVDIFMGKFSPKFSFAALEAASLLGGTLYSTYYGIDYRNVQEVLSRSSQAEGLGRLKLFRTEADPLAELCADRVTTKTVSRSTVMNGRIIEQQQILTTQNLASLFMHLELAETLGPRLPEMSRQCFKWICRRRRSATPSRHSELIVRKQTAYAWRQMVFFLSLLPEAEKSEFLRWSKDHLESAPTKVQEVIRPTWEGLQSATKGTPAKPPFLGWSSD